MSSLSKSELKNNWERVLEILENNPEVGRIKTATFFKPISVVKLNEKESKLILKCNNIAFTKNNLDSYSSEVSAAIMQVFGRNLEIELTETEVDDSPIAPPEEEAHPNPSYNFESFVQGPNNNLAMAVSLAVADRYSKNYNPLFIYGGSGLGKTHLMHAIWQYVLQNRPRKKVLYVTAETFTTELIESIRTSTQSQFKEKYRKVDYLLFDDVQFIQDKKSTIEELFNTFDALHTAGKQVIFSSDRAPKDLGDIPDRLLSRFQWGMLVDIQPPDYETRVAILKNKAELMNLTIDENLSGVLDVIAQCIQTNIRELESALTMVVTSAPLIGVELNREFAKKTLGGYAHSENVITPSLIKKTVSSYFGVKVSDIEGSKRNQHVVFPRQVAMYLIREYTNNSYPKIGELFGGRDHTTVLHSCEKIEYECVHNKEVRNSIENIRKILND